ncbi:hypothetical protein B296_00031166 [Ensete ventricosum]|uniref:Uncharacterized protein n=1 Tax=Ensete ventricosum TaxID=4639 RepID=A0A427AGY0_ENSVE|nr:hypothetical protein B296_00031166 [Ensete ventricosum]
MSIRERLGEGRDRPRALGLTHGKDFGPPSATARGSRVSNPCSYARLKGSAASPTQMIACKSSSRFHCLLKVVFPPNAPLSIPLSRLQV